MTTSDWQSWLHSWNREQFERIDPTLESLVRRAGLTVEGTLLRRYGITPELRASGWFGHPAATQTQLTELEARLGRTLPPSYRAFLAASNGFLQPGLLVWRLFPAEEVEWFRVRHQQTIDVWKSVEDLSAMLQVSAREIAGSATYLLNPNVIGADGEWEARYYAHWLGTPSIRYPSFWALMQREYGESVLKARGAGQLELEDDIQQVIVKFPALVKEFERKIRVLTEDPYVSGTPWSGAVVAVLEGAKARVIELRESGNRAEVVLHQLERLALEYGDTPGQIRTVSQSESTRRGRAQAMSAIWWYLNGRHRTM